MTKEANQLKHQSKKPSFFEKYSEFQNETKLRIVMQKLKVKMKAAGFEGF